MNDIVVGIDAGGTKTRVIVASATGERLTDLTGPGAIMTPGNAEHCADIIVQQVEMALASAEAQYKPKVLYAGVAGAGREAEQIALQHALTSRDIAEEVVVTTDATIALEDAFGENAGLILIAGTGSIAVGRSPGGIQARCGGWGIAFGDEGSGAWIGKRALSVVAAAHDGREPTTALAGAILTATQLNDPDELIPWAIAADKEQLASLAPTVMAVAMQDDLRANAIIDMAVEELMLHVRALGKRLFIDERAAFSVAFTGGLLVKGSMIRKRLERRLKTAVPGATVKAEEVIGARGAVKLAIQMLPSRPMVVPGVFDSEPVDERSSNVPDELSDEGLTDEKLADDELGDDELADEELADEELADEELADEELADEELADEELADEELADEELADEELDDEELADEELADEELDDEKLADEELADEELADEELADDDLTDESTDEITDESLTDADDELVGESVSGDDSDPLKTKTDD